MSKSLKDQGNAFPSSVLSLGTTIEIPEVIEPDGDEDGSDDSDSDSDTSGVTYSGISPKNSNLLLARSTRGRLRSEAECVAEESVDSVYTNVLSRRSLSFSLISVRMEKLDSRILHCDWVTSLTFHDNELRHLPENISSLRNLVSLNVTSNHLTTLPAGIGLLTALVRLDLSHNEIIKLPEEISCLTNLRTCILDFNKLGEFPAPLFELPDLETLSLVENFCIKTFAPAERLRSFTQLKLQIDNVPKLVEEWQTLDFPNVTLEWHKVFPDQILDFLFIGSLRTAQEQRVYDDLQINRVVTCGLGMSITLGEGMDQLLLALADTVDANLSGHLQKGIDYIADAKAKNEKVLVHCFAGLSRSASLVCAYLMRENRWTFEQSLDFVRAARPNVCPNEGFVKQLQSFEKQLGISE
eukprot:GGOE01041127.1.p1 GENE.GGOE01041127.1~~GGOE01041127.1.p1  ORF type:complete len:431 (-),score=96.46 GGOE01041127.1:580-1812(-)